MLMQRYRRETKEEPVKEVQRDCEAQECVQGQEEVDGVATRRTRFRSCVDCYTNVITLNGFHLYCTAWYAMSRQ